jgi:hypothetical protein
MALLRLDQSVGDSGSFDVWNGLIESYSYNKFITYDQLNEIVNLFFTVSNL